MEMYLTHCIFKLFVYLNKLCVYLLYFILLKTHLMSNKSKVTFNIFRVFSFMFIPIWSGNLVNQWTLVLFIYSGLPPLIHYYSSMIINIIIFYILSLYVVYIMKYFALMTIKWSQIIYIITV